MLATKTKMQFFLQNILIGQYQYILKYGEVILLFVLENVSSVFAASFKMELEATFGIKFERILYIFLDWHNRLNPTQKKQFQNVWESKVNAANLFKKKKGRLGQTGWLKR